MNFQGIHGSCIWLSEPSTGLWASHVADLSCDGFSTHSMFSLGGSGVRVLLPKKAVLRPAHNGSVLHEGRANRCFMCDASWSSGSTSGAGCTDQTRLSPNEALIELKSKASGPTAATLNGSSSRQYRNHVAVM